MYQHAGKLIAPMPRRDQERPTESQAEGPSSGNRVLRHPVTINSPTTFTIERLYVPNPAPDMAESYTGTVTVTYDDERHQTITGITLTARE